RTCPPFVRALKLRPGHSGAEQPVAAASDYAPLSTRAAASLSKRFPQALRYAASRPPEVYGRGHGNHAPQCTSSFARQRPVGGPSRHHPPWPAVSCLRWNMPQEELPDKRSDTAQREHPFRRNHRSPRALAPNTRTAVIACVHAGRCSSPRRPNRSVSPLLLGDQTLEIRVEGPHARRRAVGVAEHLVPGPRLGEARLEPPALEDGVEPFDVAPEDEDALAVSVAGAHDAVEPLRVL